MNVEGVNMKKDQIRRFWNDENAVESVPCP